MKFEPHNWRWVRYFRRLGTFGRPKIEGKGASAVLHYTKGFEPVTLTMDEFVRLVTEGSKADALKQALLDAQRSAEAPAGYAVQIESGAVDTRPGIKPPSDPDADNWTWQKWDALARGNGAAPGWSFCRFANRTGETNVAFVFGLVRGSFGVWQQPFDVCTESGRANEVMTCITHLRSGIGCGVFAERMVAIEAAELADRLFDAHLAEIDGDSAHRLHTAWEAAGIRPASNAHCHDGHGNTFELIGRDSILEGKPERLS